MLSSVKHRIERGLLPQRAVWDDVGLMGEPGLVDGFGSFNRLVESGSLASEEGLVVVSQGGRESEGEIGGRQRRTASGGGTLPLFEDEALAQRTERCPWRRAHLRSATALMACP